ncbi:hypothetical protein CPB85DRAFT_591588 [Mucidula mucida]|nr:hypothetical protein CPB85DRAFT_591588 [Mucidula mucida]
MASSAFILSFVYYTFMLALVEASRAVICPAPTPFIPNNIDVTALLASSAIAALALLALIFIVYGLLRQIDWYADEYMEVLSGLLRRVPSRVVPLVGLAVSVILYDVCSSSKGPLQSMTDIIYSTFTTPTLLYFVAFGAAVIHRVMIVLNVFQDVEYGIKLPEDVDEKQLLSDWERHLFAERESKRYMLRRLERMYL